MHLTTSSFDPSKPDVVCDIDGVVFKFNVIEEYILWLCREGVFAPLPDEIMHAKLTWKAKNTEANYKLYLALLVKFFISEVRGKRISSLREAARIVASQTAFRTWDITLGLMEVLHPTHNLIAISLMPEWLMSPFTEGLPFVRRLGSIYVVQDGAFTGEADSIDKATTYAKLRRGDFSHLDVVMGDTTGDRTILEQARRPIAFNPSRTLIDELQSWVSIVAAEKDGVVVTNRNSVTGDSHETGVSTLLHCSDASDVLGLIQARP